MILEKDNGRIAINSDKLITALRTAVDNDGVLDKESTSYSDIFDAFRLALNVTMTTNALELALAFTYA